MTVRFVSLHKCLILQCFSLQVAPPSGSQTLPTHLIVFFMIILHARVAAFAEPIDVPGGIHITFPSLHINPTYLTLLQLYLSRPNINAIYSSRHIAFGSSRNKSMNHIVPFYKGIILFDIQHHTSVTHSA